jgi:hypothetical protein
MKTWGSGQFMLWLLSSWLPPKEPHWKRRLLGPYNWSVHCEERNPLPLPRTESWSLGCSSHSLITILSSICAMTKMLLTFWSVCSVLVFYTSYNFLWTNSLGFPLEWICLCNPLPSLLFPTSLLLTTNLHEKSGEAHWYGETKLPYVVPLHELIEGYHRM